MQEKTLQTAQNRNFSTAKLHKIANFHPKNCTKSYSLISKQISDY